MGTVTHVAPPQRVRMPHQTLCVTQKKKKIVYRSFHFSQLRIRPQIPKYLTTAPAVTPSDVNGVSDKEWKLSACEINLAGPLVPEDRENKLFQNVGNYYHAIRHRIRGTKIFVTPVWPRQTLHWFVEAILNTVKNTGIVGAHALSSNSSCSIMHT